MVRWWESPHKILHKHTDTCVTQWRFKRTVSKRMDTHPQKKKTHKLTTTTEAPSCTTNFQHSLHKWNDRKVRVSGSCSSLLSPPFTLSPHCHVPVSASRGITSKIPTEGYFADPLSYKFCLVWCPDWCKSKLSKSVLGNQSQSPPPHAPPRAGHVWHKREGRRTRHCKRTRTLMG